MKMKWERLQSHNLNLQRITVLNSDYPVYSIINAQLGYASKNAVNISLSYFEFGIKNSLNR